MMVVVKYWMEAMFLFCLTTSGIDTRTQIYFFYFFFFFFKILLTHKLRNRIPSNMSSLPDTSTIVCIFLHFVYLYKLESSLYVWKNRKRKEKKTWFFDFNTPNLSLIKHFLNIPCPHKSVIDVFISFFFLFYIERNPTTFFFVLLSNITHAAILRDI
jgi:hypothetical protein